MSYFSKNFGSIRKISRAEMLTLTIQDTGFKKLRWVKSKITALFQSTPFGLNDLDDLENQRLFQEVIWQIFQGQVHLNTHD